MKIRHNYIEFVFYRDFKLKGHKTERFDCLDLGVVLKV